MKLRSQIQLFWLYKLVDCYVTLAVHLNRCDTCGIITPTKSVDIFFTSIFIVRSRIRILSGRCYVYIQRRLEVVTLDTGHKGSNMTPCYSWSLGFSTFIAIPGLVTTISQNGQMYCDFSCLGVCWTRSISSNMPCWLHLSTAIMEWQCYPRWESNALFWPLVIVCWHCYFIDDHRSVHANNMLSTVY